MSEKDVIRVAAPRDIKFDDLPYKTKEFLLDLRHNEVEEIKDAMELVKMVRSTAKVLRWLVFGIIATIVSFGMGFDAFKKLLLWYKGGP